MFTIRRRTLDTFARHLDERFRTRLAARLKLLFPEEVLNQVTAKLEGPDRLGSFVSFMIERGRALDITAYPDLAVFVALVPASVRCTQPGEQAYLEWARPLLDREDADGQSKIALIDHELRLLAQRDERAQWLCSAIDTLRGPF